jgi:tetratricopeptide (TPR) repeat protein
LFEKLRISSRSCITQLALLLVLFCLTTPSIVWSQSPAFSQTVQRFVKLVKKGDYTSADPLAEKILEYAKNELPPNDIQNGVVFGLVSSFYRLRGRIVDAERLIKRILEIAEKSLGPTHIEVAHVLNALALNYDSQGRYVEAEPLYKRSLGIREKSLAHNHPDLAQSFNNIALNMFRRGAYVEAERFFKRALTIYEKKRGVNELIVAQVRSNLALNYDARGHYEKAAPLHKQSFDVREQALGSNHPDVAQSLNNIATNYLRRGRYSEAEPLYKQSLAIYDAATGNYQFIVGQIVSNFALNYDGQGRYSKAETLHKRSLQINKKSLPPNHPNIARSLINLASNYDHQSLYARAASLYERALAIFEEALGSNHPDVATTLRGIANNFVQQGRYKEVGPLIENALKIQKSVLGLQHSEVAHSMIILAYSYDRQGRYEEAENLYYKSLAIYRHALGENHRNVANTLSKLANNYVLQGRFAEALSLQKSSLEIREKALGPSHPDVAQSLNNLAFNFDRQGRYSEAEPLYLRSLIILKKTLGPDHSELATALSNRANNLVLQGRHAEALPLQTHSLEVREKIFGTNHPDIAESLNNLAYNYERLGQYSKAERLYKRSLIIAGKALGQHHSELATTLSNIANIYIHQGRYAEAESELKRSIEIAEKALGDGHPDVARSLGKIAQFYAITSNYHTALSYIRRATSILKKRAAIISMDKSTGRHRERETKKVYHAGQIWIISRVKAESEEPTDELTAEAFAAAQLANVSSAGTALSRMAARFAAGNDDLANLTRERQNAINGWRALDKNLLKSIGRPPGKRNEILERNLRKQLKELDARLGNLDERLSTKFPEYAALMSQQPLPLSEAQDLIGSDEALVTYLIDEKESYLWVVRKNKAVFLTIEMKGADLISAVAELRKSLDVAGIKHLSDIPPFDTTKAYELYQKIFSPAERMLKGVRHVMVVPDGALQSLPLGVLVTEKPQGSFTSGYRKVPWLAKKYALSILPSVNSLKALRTFAKKTQGENPFVGFGDPVLNGVPGESRGVKVANLFSRGPVVNAKTLHELGRLSDTAVELKAIAKTLGVNNDSLYLAERATESRVKDTDLSDTKILAFATHGLIAGQYTDVQEPGLVLTPPTEGTLKDDGYLTASEVAQLKLNADWVILSACNTASPDGNPGAQGLSGLAKAFFYAGSRALLVSHWPVASAATTALTTRMLKEAKDKSIGRAEALKRSMISLMNSPQKPYLAHPIFWAPFSIVGEGN